MMRHEDILSCYVTLFCSLCSKHTCIPFQIPYYGISICTDEQNDSLYAVLDWDISIAVFDLVAAFI